MAALAVFSSCANSHPFQDRRVALTESQKIGRSVAQARPSPTNAVFDCKVLSRNHALIWYDNGKFYLQDTKSSNGTFVNSQRLSKGSEESDPREIYSGDTVQFGVDVVENSRKVTHSCIIATIRLYFPDGNEAINSHSNSFGSGGSSVVNSLQSQELYQLAQFLQEALHREQVLENKLSTLQRLVQSTQEASENGWQALVDEDRLLSRLEVLESQLTAYSRNEDTLRQELVTLHDEKFTYETTAKESLRKVLEEKLEAVQRIFELERSLSNAETEKGHIQEAKESAETELQTLAEKYQEQVTEAKELVEKLQESEKQHQDRENSLEKEKQELQNKIDTLLLTEESLQAKVESLQANNDFTTEQLNNLKVKLETVKRYSSSESLKIQEFSMNDQAVQVELVNLLDLQLLQGSDDDECDDEDESEAFRKKEQTSKGEKKKQGGLDISQFLKNGINPEKDDDDMEILQKEYKSSSTASQNHDTCQSNECSALVTSLKGEIARLNDLLAQSNESLNKAHSEVEKLNDEITSLRNQLKSAGNLSPDSSATTPVGNEILPHIDLNTDDMKGQVALLREQLETAEKNAKYSHIEVDQLRDRVKTLTAELELERMRLSGGGGGIEGENVAAAGEGGSDGNKDVNTVQHEIQKELARNRAEFSVLKDECASLRQRIHDIETEMKMSRLENYQLKEEYGRLQASYKELEQLKSQLQSSEVEWQSNLTDAQKEADKYKQQLAGITEEMKRLQAVHETREREITALRQQLESQVERALVSVTTAPALTGLPPITSPLEPTGSLDDSDDGGASGFAAVVGLNDSLKEKEEDDEYKVLALQCRTVSLVSMVPLLMLVLAFLMAFLPFLSTITATGSPAPGAENT